MTPINIEFRATSKLDSRYIRFLGEVEYLGYKYIGEVRESSFLFTYFDIVVDDSHSCTISVTQEQIQKLENALAKELNAYETQRFYFSPSNTKLKYKCELCKHYHNYCFLEYNSCYWECVRLLHRCIKDINDGVNFDWNKDTLEIIFSW